MIDPPTRLVLLGHPVAHSISPRIQNAALGAAHIPLTYETMDVEPARLEDTLVALAAARAAGNVTIPHKEAVAARCASLTPLARRVGAVNTFWHEGGLLVGDNTDVGGVDATVRALLGERMRSARVALIGAGGGAAAVLAAAERWGGVRVAIYNRHMTRAQGLAARFPAVAEAVVTLADALRDATLVVNTTPVGMRDAELPVPLELLPSGAAVFDLVYRAGETAWVTGARQAGHRSADGIGMLVEQGALAFARWFGMEPDRDAMWRAMP
ncbi:MAG TPA: shikimate dehydrogenase [Gemmatimonadaceae bacterium]|nr:shikimate dehydrogenase [Gemmatimonadaceae bacterium]